MLHQAQRVKVSLTKFNRGMSTHTYITTIEEELKSNYKSQPSIINPNE